MTVSLTTEHNQVLQAVYDHFRKHGSWPAFTAVDRPLRRDHGLDVAAIVVTLPKALAIPPRDGLRPADDDQIRLSLLGIQQCQGSTDDAERFTRLLRWFAKKELEYEPGSPEERLQVAAAEAASYLGVENDHPVMRRIRAMFELDRLGVHSRG